MKRAIKRVIDGLQDHQGAIDPGVVELLAELVKLAAAVIPGLLKRGKLEEAIEEAIREMPSGWCVAIEIENGGTVVTIPSIAENASRDQMSVVAQIAKDLEEALE